MEVCGLFRAPVALSRAKEPRYPPNRRLGGPQSPSGRNGEEKKVPSLSLPRIEPGSSFRMIHSNIILPSTPRSSERNFVRNFNFSPASYMFRLHNPLSLGHPNIIWRSVQIMKLFLIMQSLPASSHFLPLRSKYSSQRPVLRNPQSTFFS
jgi:hypothetical protein